MSDRSESQNTSARRFDQADQAATRGGFSKWLAGGNPVECWPEQLGGEPAGGREGPLRGGPPGRRPGSPYFTSDRKTVDEGEGQEKEQEGPVLSKRFECRAVGCKCWFCPHCCMSKALALKQRLLPVLRTFKAMMMLTLTIDPKLFPTPEAAFRHVREKRAIAELVRALRKRGYVLSSRFFYVVEWQKQTEMAHFHVLVESHRIPFGELAKLWGRNRPAWAPRWQGSYDRPLQGQSPEFGHVRFSQGFGAPEHAAHYACKYLNKIPEHGYPDWVLNFRGQIKRFSSSRGLLATGETKAVDDDEPESDHPATCFCEDCRNGPAEKAGPDDDSTHEPSTVAQRLAKCATKSCVLEVMETMDDQGEIHEQRRFVGFVRMPFDDVLRRLGCEALRGRCVGLRPREFIQRGGDVELTPERVGRETNTKRAA